MFDLYSEWLAEMVKTLKKMMDGGQEQEEEKKAEGEEAEA